MNNVAYFEIQAAEPTKAVEFYATAFGWKFVKEETFPIEYYRLTEDQGIMGAILKRPVEVPPMKYGTNAFTCSIQVENFDATSKKILAVGAIVAMDKFAVPGRCWQGYFLDIDHNVFGIFEADTNAK